MSVCSALCSYGGCQGCFHCASQLFLIAVSPYSVSSSCHIWLWFDWVTHSLQRMWNWVILNALLHYAFHNSLIANIYGVKMCCYAHYFDELFPKLWIDWTICFAKWFIVTEALETLHAAAACWSKLCKCNKKQAKTCTKTTFANTMHFFY